MRLTRALALLAFAVLLAYLAVYLVRVPRLDLAVVVTATVLLVAWDLWTQIGPRRR